MNVSDLSRGIDDKDAADTDNAGANKDNTSKPPYTVNAVLHFLQHELNRYEQERLHWELERAEMKARIQFLNGERKGQEELKKDLVRRIKMLEYSLRQERAKLQRLKGERKGEQGDEEEDNAQVEESFAPIEVDATVPSVPSSQIYTKARSLLRQYLEEVGYTEKILDVRSFRVKSILGLTGENEPKSGGDNGDKRKSSQRHLEESETAVLNAADAIRHHRGDAKNTRKSGGSADNVEFADNLDLDAVTALDEFAFLKDEKSGLNETIVSGSQPLQTSQSGAPAASSDEIWNVDQNVIKQMKDNYRSEQARKRANSSSSSDATDSSNDSYENEKADKSGEYGDLNALTPSLGFTEDINIKDNFADSAGQTPQVQWKIRFTLRSHLDSVRAMQFHPLEPVLITASEDATIKMWNLGDKAIAENAKSSASAQGAMGIVDLEPRYTFRGHKGPILSMATADTGQFIVTGGHDGSVCCWDLPSFNIPVYDQYDKNLMTERLIGHTDCVWNVVYHSSTNRVVSGSADGTIRVWELQTNRGDASSDPQLQLFKPPAERSRPRSLDLVSTEAHQLLTAYSNAYAGILDLETGKRVLEFNMRGAVDEEVGEINKVLSHPTMPLTITAGTDRRIRYFDNNTGKLIYSSVAHIESVSTLSADPNGLYMLSGSDDGSIRLWDIQNRICLQEIAVHRKKHDMSVMAVAFHPSRSLIGSAGADSLVKVFSSQATQDLAAAPSATSVL